ncbi:exotoxin beta-grasp domain-containing protein [Staphylococcus agnetis]|uniref:exotoxin beta-grasp domain-containing protein n=1 Tax=Staphylococcus agnetis TaxID=985762 RepID=UPI0021CEE0A0|nr:superantigen-like protein [Staphylococcus agnetis]UXU59661.1 superantigen-like protein [Staphylococcus agnetis]UXU61989.1 superantigen-like protein [Staphylococcus agnetis]
MKLSTIAKTSLALGILTTGVMTTYAQSADAEGFTSGKVTLLSSQEASKLNSLKEYYGKKALDLRNVQGQRIGDKVSIIDNVQLTEVTLTEKDKNRLKNNDFSDFDVFIVKEGTGRDATIQSIGGITKPNSLKNIDYVASPQLSITRKSGEYTATHNDAPFLINKEEISLKELDFKLRKQLMEKHGLYKENVSNGKIVVKMKSEDKNDKYTFDLSEKLQKERMGDVIVDTTKIDRIEVSL